MKNLHPVDTQQTYHHANRISHPIVHNLHHKTTHFDVQKHYAEKHKHKLKKKKNSQPIARKLRTLSKWPIHTNNIPHATQQLTF
jgi:hypothetical protein